MRLTPAELMNAIKISTTTYKMWVKEGMPCVRLSSSPNAHRRFNLEEVEAWLKERHTPKEEA